MSQSSRRLLGDPLESNSIKEMIRVDHAGEYGAVRIYQGQLKILGKKPISTLLNHMLEQEKAHLAKFDKEIVNRRIRPTVLLPFWHVCGFALGAGSALLGEKAAMACTVAVEEVIDQHYLGQIEALEGNEKEKELKTAFEEFRAEELEHRDSGIEAGAENIQGYHLFSKVIKRSARIAIWLSEKL